jgi:YD repeat-containing protein
MKKRHFLQIIMFCFVGTVFAQSMDRNYIRTRTYTSSDNADSTAQNTGDNQIVGELVSIDTIIYLNGIIDLIDFNRIIHFNEIIDLYGATYLDEIKYFDGLGRHIETVQRGVSPSNKDLITYIEYDAMGRQDKTWLPRPTSQSNGNFIDLNTFKNLPNDIYKNDDAPFAKTIYEKSPLGRVSEQYGAGGDWHINGKSIKTEYLTNSRELYCRRYIGTNSVISYAGGYADGTLYVTKTSDEDGNISYEFKNKQGQIILTRHQDGNTNFDTYYVYDDLGNLVCVIPPIFADIFVASRPSSDKDDMFLKYAYWYKYNTRNLCIEKRLPGCEPVYYVYDKADRLIFSQDGNQRKEGKCYFSIPDVFGRVCLTGLCSNAVTSLNNPLQNVIVTAVRSSDGSNYGYQISGVNLTGVEILSVNYYDDYNFINTFTANTGTNANFDFSYSQETGYGKMYETSSKGLLTGTITAITDGAQSGNEKIYTAMYYDNRVRMVQKRSNTVYPVGMDIEYFAYDFTGQITNKKHLQTPADASFSPIEEHYVYNYDHAERLLNTNHTLITNAGEITALLAYNEYDELGRLKLNAFGEMYNMQELYNYNVRSWLTGINGELFNE